MIEYGTPAKLLKNEASAFSKMVQSTGPANAEYLRGLVVARKDRGRADGEMAWLLSSRWNAAVQHALAANLNSAVNDLQVLDFEANNNVISRTKNAVVLLQDVLLGKHDGEIDETLEQFEVSRYTWWSAFYRVIEGVLKPQVMQTEAYFVFPFVLI